VRAEAARALACSSRVVDPAFWALPRQEAEKRPSDAAISRWQRVVADKRTALPRQDAENDIEARH
jgi:hypothetical protein